MTTTQSLFDKLRQRQDSLAKRPSLDSEEWRLQNLVRPLIVHPCALGWRPSEVIPKKRIHIPSSVYSDFVIARKTFGAPHQLEPDLVVIPEHALYDSHVGSLPFVLEAKKLTQSADSLREHRYQLQAYLHALETSIGILTDGEHWLLYQGPQPVASYDSLDDLYRDFGELRDLLGRDAFFARLGAVASNKRRLSLLPIAFGSLRPILASGRRQRVESVTPELRERLRNDPTVVDQLTLDAILDVAESSFSKHWNFRRWVDEAAGRGRLYASIDISHWGHPTITFHDVNVFVRRARRRSGRALLRLGMLDIADFGFGSPLEGNRVVYSENSTGAPGAAFAITYSENPAYAAGNTNSNLRPRYEFWTNGFLTPDANRFAERQRIATVDRPELIARILDPPEHESDDDHLNVDGEPPPHGS